MWLAAVILAQVFDGYSTEAAFLNREFAGEVQFRGEHKQSTHLNTVRFRNRVRFNGTQLHGETTFTRVHFAVDGLFYNADFHGPTSFRRPSGNALKFAGGTVFHENLWFANPEVSETIFNGVTFDGAVTIAGQNIRDFLFDDCTFARPPRLERAQFAGTLSFANSTFKEGLDLRFTDLSKTKRVVLAGIEIDPRDLRVSWSSLRGKLDVDRDKNPDIWFPHLEASYRLVAAALEAHDNEDDAERALHELEVRRQKELGGFWHGLHGLVLGYGYEPWRVVFVILPLIALFALLLIPHRATVAAILDADIKNGAVPQASVTRSARVAHLLFFSTAVLLGIRFKQEWIQPSNTPFVLLVAAEWAIGIALYIAFFALVKTSGFAYVKGLLGF
jgi:hypothetical protein